MLFLFMQVFFTNHIVNSQVLVTEQEHIHLSKVLRKQVGDEVIICNGKGFMAIAMISSISKKETLLSVVSVLANETMPASKLILAVAPTKNMDRYEWFIEKAIEIGVNQFQPFFSQNSERRNLKLERLELIAIAAMKQSKAIFLPEILEPVSFDSLILNTSIEQKFIAYVPENKLSIQSPLKTLNYNTESIFLVGPEGGFTKEEAAKAQKLGFVSISLGDKRLRTETAGVFIASAYQLFTP
jgi:16S rRNA (uracil1498-N3)-methyltransferase